VTQATWDASAGRLAADLGRTSACGQSCGQSGSRPACALVPAIEFAGYDGYPSHGLPRTRRRIAFRHRRHRVWGLSCLQGLQRGH
jgi:hypothetical protein